MVIDPPDHSPHTGVAQLAEQRSPKPQVVGSSPTARAETKTNKYVKTNYLLERCCKGSQEGQLANS